jgi:hypothetical protein
MSSSYSAESSGVMDGRKGIQVCLDMSDSVDLWIFMIGLNLEFFGFVGT